MKFIYLFLCFTFLSSIAKGQDYFYGKEVLFFDDFNDPSGKVDTTVWRLCDYANNTWSQHFKNTEGFENVKIENGILKISATKDEKGYKNGGIRTKIGFPCNSRLEVKAKIKKVGGAFPAIWQMPINGDEWPKAGEIDVMEWIQSEPNRIYQTIHTQYMKDTTGGTGCTNENPNMNLDAEEEHIYAVDRRADKLIFYVDGMQTWTYENLNLDEKLGQYPFCDKDFDIILNYSLGGTLNGQPTWPGPINDDELPGAMWVDWVRVTSLD